MRSLTVKLTLAFLIVSLIGTLLAAAIIRQRMRSEFDRFLYRQDTVELAGTLVAYYAVTGSWQGCDQIFAQYLQQRRAEPAAAGELPQRRPPAVLPLTLAAADGIVVYGPEERIGRPALPAELRAGVPLELDNRVVGYLLVGPRRALSPELAFLQQANLIILFSALISVLVALLIGAVLARTLTSPIRELIDAAHVIARGDLGHQVPVRSQDELGRLAIAFNRMSSDLDRSNRQRKQMTADIAHDLRTPLSLILGYTEALSDGKLTPTAEIFGVMHQEAGHLNRLIDDLRLISLADAGELPLTLAELPAAALIERAVAAFRAQAESKGIGLEVHLPGDLPMVRVDPERMAQVLGNLISNALRYTPAGGRVTLAGAGAAGGVLLSVADSGPGIPAAELERIFDRFYRADKARTQNGESGLGLTIARSLVQAHGGRITVESTLGQGTTFTIFLPTPTAA